MSEAAPDRVGLFVIGAMKCGSTTLYDLLAAHPQICMCREKEPAHFVGPEAIGRLRPSRTKRWWTTEDYHSLFEPSPRTRIWGEASTFYTRLPLTPGVAERIHAYNPDARMIYIVRNPFARTVSHYHHDYREGFERREILQAVTEEPHYLDLSDYAMQLAPFRDRFPREHIKVLILERFQRQQEDTIESICDWLGLDRPMRGEETARHAVHVTERRVGPMRGGLRRERLLGLWDSAPWRAFSRAAPPWMKEALRTLVYARRIDTKDVPYDRLRALVGDRLSDMAARFREMTGDDLPEWRTGPAGL